MPSCQAAQQCKIVEVNIYDSYKFNNVQGTVCLFLQSPCATTWLGKIQVLVKLPGGQWARSEATVQLDTLWQILFWSMLTGHPLQTFSEFIQLFMTVKKPRKLIKRQRIAAQRGYKNSNSFYCQYLVHALTDWVIKTISPQETLLYTYCTASPFISVQMVPEKVQV